ncbi:MAG: ABC transporter ATP-binding protein/permease [Oscillospiraceae bacterium]|nr:ABC transporter ATP-binding protein/permease [Oscillospiraceae bacterium]
MAEISFREKKKRETVTGSRWAVLKRLLRSVAGFRRMYLLLLLLLVLSLAVDLSLPLIIESAINAISFADGISVDFPALTFSLAVLAAAAVFAAVLGCAQERLSANVTLQAAMKIRQELFDSLMDSPVSQYEKMRRGDMMSRMTCDCDLAAGAFTESFKELVSSLLVACGCAVIMFIKCSRLAAVSTGSAMVSVLLTGLISGMIYPAVLRQQTALGVMNAHVEETLKAFRTCTACGRGEENTRSMEILSRQYYQARLHANSLEYLMGPLVLLFGNLNFLLTVVFGVRMMSAGVIGLGAMQAFIMYSRQFMEPLNALGENFAMVQSALAAAERVFSVIDGEKERDLIARAAESVERHAEDRAELSFRELSFGYHQNRPVLKKLCLRVSKGERLALVGRTGEGKTTLSNLLLGFYPEYEGEIRMQGDEIRSLDPGLLRSRIAVVAQEPQLIAGSIYENLIYGCGEVSREEVLQVLDRLGIGELFAGFPGGLDTGVGKSETEMSQGQMQLICLVRAVLRKAEILILDEATASLDPCTEQTVQKAVENAAGGRTCIVIAHRLSTVRDADRIAVLADGGIRECGTHEDLMQKRGIYYELYHRQFLGQET